MPDSVPSTMVGAETERFDQAFAELRAKAKRYSILAGVFFIVAVVLAVIHTVLLLKLLEMPSWLNTLFDVISTVFFLAMAWCTGYEVCLAWILLRCRCGAPTSLPIQYFIVKDGNNSSPSIVDRLDKPLLLLPQGPDLNIPEISEGDRQAAVEDALSRAQHFWYRVDSVIRPSALISLRPLQTKTQETPMPEEV